MKNHVLIRKDDRVMLTPHEKGLLEALFKEDEIQINMNEVATRLNTQSKLFGEPLGQEIIQRGWLDMERKQKRFWLAVSGLLTMVLSMIVFILGVVGASADGCGGGSGGGSSGAGQFGSQETRLAWFVLLRENKIIGSLQLPCLSS